MHHVTVGSLYGMICLMTKSEPQKLPIYPSFLSLKEIYLYINYCPQVSFSINLRDRTESSPRQERVDRPSPIILDTVQIAMADAAVQNLNLHIFFCDRPLNQNVQGLIILIIFIHEENNK